MPRSTSPFASLAPALAGFLPLVAGAALLATTSCGTGEVAVASGPTAPGSGAVTFHRDVAPILQKSCQGCHVTGGIAPFALLSYDDARPMAGVMASATASGVMPPWGAHPTPDCDPTRPWKNDLRLSEAELATLRAWSDAGAPEGDPADAPPRAPPPRTDLVGAQKTLRSETGFAMSGEVDRLRCFVLDPQITAESWIDGMQVVPEHPEVVHHALIFADPKGASRAKADASGQYDCFGGAQVEGATLLTAWAPGGTASELPPGVGMPVDPGTLLVMQVHYHAAPGLSAPPDHTAVQLRFTEQKPSLFAFTQLVGNFRGSLGPLGGLASGPNDPGKPEFLVPPNVKDHTETMKLTMPASIKGKPTDDFRLLATSGHMHYVGVAESVRVARKAPPAGAPAEECLLSIPRWDFDWQRTYTYDVPIDQLPRVAAGDELAIECTYDNTMGNPKMGRALREAGMSSPQPVSIGESTLDEMCLAAFVFVYQP